LATPNYGYEKRQKELAKKRKKEDKLKAKSERRPDMPGSEDATDDASAGMNPPAVPDAPPQP
jgi:hypothetical protein